MGRLLAVVACRGGPSSRRMGILRFAAFGGSLCCVRSD